MIRQKTLLVAIGFELAAAAGLAVLRLVSTAPTPPLVQQYNDTLTGQELLSLPDSFLYDSVEKWRTLAETYAAFGYFSKADACFRRARAANPASAEIAYQHGYCLNRLGRVDEALAAFAQVIELNDPLYTNRAWFHIGESNLRLERAEVAMHAFEQAGDGHFPSVYQRARFLVRSGRATDAVPLLQVLGDAFPRDVRVWRLRAQAASDQGLADELSQARDALEIATVDLMMDDLEAVHKRIRARFAMAREISLATEQKQAGNAAAAADRLTRLVKQNTRWENVYLLLLQDAADFQVMAENTDVARELLTRQIEVEQFPTPVAWQLRGEVEFAGHNWQAARDAWTRAEFMRPGSVDQIKFATAIEHLGDIAQAKRHLALAGLFAGKNRFRQGEFESARTMLQQAASIDPDVADLWFYLGECERRLGDDRQAESAFRRCRE
ncbi:MAG: tetratricopeptide repeat protein, partial [Planctomycetia bacterium]|nr:tetratricopeptide repeat protein [Planctomycetia bacterium]